MRHEFKFEPDPDPAKQPKWINFYINKYGQSHFGTAPTDTWDESDRIRRAYLAQIELAKLEGLTLAFNVAVQKALFYEPAFLAQFEFPHPDIRIAEDTVYSAPVPYFGGP